MEEIITDIMECLKKDCKKLTKEGLRKKIGAFGEKRLAFFNTAIRKLEEEGKIYIDKDGYVLEFNPKVLGKVQGILTINKSGQGHVTIEKGSHKLHYNIDKYDLAGALDGDIVVLKNIHDFKKFHTAEVEKIIKRSPKEIVLEYLGGQRFTPYNSVGSLTVVCPKEDLIGLVKGHRVLATISKNTIAVFDGKVFAGKITKIIGHKDDPNIEIETIANAHGFTTEFPKEVIEELKNIPDTIENEDLSERIDLRNETIFTIDGSDTKDIDDAISIKKDGEDYILSVHIADVSHYVKEGSALYKEALKRGNSAYLANTVIPMLPHRLSNGICSLNPGADRLAKTVKMRITNSGKIVDYEIFDSVICSRKQMTYDDVNDILEHNIIKEDYKPFIEDLKTMQELSTILRKRREKKGALNFYSDEVKIIFDEQGRPISFDERKQKTAEKIIENFMIAANESVTEYYYYMNVPFIYRTHGTPEESNLIGALKVLISQDLCPAQLANRLINKIANNRFTSKDLEDFLNKFRNSENYSIISKIILQSMQKAIYSSKNEGHYGLALKNYTHFTSPIRRFPDLEVHHLINHYKTFENLGLIEKKLPEICSHSSKMEREADKAEREVLELKMAEYMQNYVGKQFRGRVTRLTPFGLSIRLDNNVCVVANSGDIKRAPGTSKIKLGDRVYTLVKEVSIPFRTIYVEASKEPIETENQKKLTKKARKAS